VDGGVADAPDRPTAAQVLAARNRSAGLDVVDELTRISAALATGGGTTSAEILAVADLLAELRTSVTFAELVDGF
jgi:hypothetical protein